jgi:hypothetical protein
LGWRCRASSRAGGSGTRLSSTRDAPSLPPAGGALACAAAHGGRGWGCCLRREE